MQFSQIVGQRELINKLTEIIDQNRISHAQLFLGSNGFGSLAISIAYAQYVNCTQPLHFDIKDLRTQLKADSCGVCPSCIKYQTLEHPDLHFIFPNTTTTKVKSQNSSKDFQAEFMAFLHEKKFYAELIDWFEYLGVDNKQGTINVRDSNEIIRLLSYKSYESKYKVVIIWMIEKLYYQAAPKLLKILEEPSDNTLFLLISENKDKVLDTILSRAQLVKIDRISNEDLTDSLTKKGFPVGNNIHLINAAEGNYAVAIKSFQQLDNHNLFIELFVRWMRFCFKLQMAELSKWVDEIADLGREQQKSFLNYCLQIFRACILKNYTPLQNLTILDFNDPKFNNSFPLVITARNIENIEKKINNTLYEIERNANPKILFMSLSFEMSRLLK